MTTLHQALATVVDGQDLSADDIAAVFAHIMAGQATEAQIAGLLIALRMKGETSEELAGAARAMRAHATPFACPDPEHSVDTCGTGGDGSGSVNVSTMAAIVAAAAGAPVAKHGNRAQSSRAGSADVLEALGVVIDCPRAVAEACLREVGIAFLFAPAFHAATRHAVGPRRQLGVRTIFNLLGPMTNPAQVRNQIVGVFAEKWCAPVARALGQLGARRAYVVHGAGGIDEIAVRGATTMAIWRDEAASTGDAVETRSVTPADFGLPDADPAGLAGGDASENAAIARQVLAGADLGDGREAIRNAILMEAAVALCAAGVDDLGPGPEDFPAATQRAADAIASGACTRTLERWIEVSRG